MSTLVGPLLSGYARDAVIVWLQTYLNNALASDDILRSDKINIETVPSSSYYIDEAFVPMVYPAIYVLADKFTFDYGSAPNYVNGVIDLQIVVVVQDLRFDDLHRKVESYVRALFKTLDQQSIKDSGNRFQLKMVSKDYEITNTFESKASGGQKYFKKAAIYRWTAKHFENRLATIP